MGRMARAIRFSLLPVFLVALAFHAIVATAGAQVQSGTITGLVQDQQGGVLPGVTVTLTGPDRTATFVTGSDGRYRFLNVAPGTVQGDRRAVRLRNVAA